MFWILSAAWTVLAIIINAMEFSIQPAPRDRFGTLGDPTVISVGLATWLLVLVAIYVLSGLRIVREWERLPVLLFGKYKTTLTPGLKWYDPIFHTFLDRVTIQDTVSELEVKNVQTRDNVPISFTVVVTKRVEESKVRDFVVQVEDGDDAVDTRAQVAAIESVGTKNLDDILHDRSAFAQVVEEALRPKIDKWGIMVLAVEISDLEITDESIKQAIAMKARAKKEAEGDLERAGMQLEIARKLAEAGGEYTPEARWLKGLEVMIEMTRSANNNTIIIPTDGVNDMAKMAAMVKGLQHEIEPAAPAVPETPKA
jgi:regulator of protease activity HflC (stomatin/prohibitin superfamily)